MRSLRFLRLLAAPILLSVALANLAFAAPSAEAPSAYSPPSIAAPYVEGLVETNGVRLQYLDWGGNGPALILLHGLADNPYVFEDIAPAFTDRFRVIAYARRGSPGSDVKGPYDVGTLTEDLRGLMDALKIAKADLVGYSAGGDEITEMVARYPSRVNRIVYFDSAYDWADPDFRAAIDALPLGFFDLPDSAMSSLDSYRSYYMTKMFPGLDDMRRLEANLRQKVVIRNDGTVSNRTPKEVVDALYAAFWANGRRDYDKVQCPALAIYAEHLYDVNIADEKQRAQLIAYEKKYWKPYQAKYIDRIRKQHENIQVMHVPGAHVSFILTERDAVVSAVRQFLGAPLQAEVR